jgi:hypothetical protein
MRYRGSLVCVLARRHPKVVCHLLATFPVQPCWPLFPLCAVWHLALQPFVMLGSATFRGLIATHNSDSRYWLSRIFRPVNDRGEMSPHYSMKVQFHGRRMAFTLGSENKEAAARRAAGIYGELLSFGVEVTLAKHRAQSPRKIPSEVATIGEWIEAACGVSASNAATFAQYAASLRLIAGQILSVRKTKKRFGPGKGGAQAYRAGIDGASLEILSAQAAQRWRLAYVAQAKNPAQERSRMTSANSTIRQARRR